MTDSLNSWIRNGKLAPYRFIIRRVSLLASTSFFCLMRILKRRSGRCCVYELIVRVLSEADLCSIRAINRVVIHERESQFSLFLHYVVRWACAGPLGGTHIFALCVAATRTDAIEHTYDVLYVRLKRLTTCRQCVVLHVCLTAFQSSILWWW